MSRNKKYRGDPNKPPEFVQLLNWVRKTEAWRSLKPWSRLLYIELRGKYNSRNNGDISMSYQEAEQLLGCSNKPIPNAFWELQDRGLIKAVQKGSFSWKVRFEGKGRATTWLLTEKKTRHAKSGPDARQKRAIPADMARQKRAYGTPEAGHFEQNALHNGTPKAGTFISTISPQLLGQVTAALLNSRLVKKANGAERKNRRRAS